MEGGMRKKRLTINMRAASMAYAWPLQNQPDLTPELTIHWLANNTRYITIKERVKGNSSDTIC